MELENIQERIKDIEKRVKEIVCKQLGIMGNDVNAETKFEDDLGADSLDMIEIAMALEEEYGLEISDEQKQTIDTIGKAAKFIAWKKGISFGKPSFLDGKVTIRKVLGAHRPAQI